MTELKKKLVLASGSPRRSELLSKLGLEFEVIKPDFNEEFNKELPAMEVPLFLSELKAAQIPEKKTDTIYLTSDTVVIQGSTILGKPTDLREAKEFLSSFSNQSHLVITGVCIHVNGRNHSFSETTKVNFYPLLENEIDDYLNKHTPLDKAGAYGIQEWIGHGCIKSIEGNYDNVVGLPASRLYQELKKLDLFK